MAYSNTIDYLCIDDNVVIIDNEFISNDEIIYDTNDSISYNDIYMNTLYFYNNEQFYKLTTKDFETFGSDDEYLGPYYNIFNSCHEDDNENKNSYEDSATKNLTYMDFVHNTHMFHIMNNWLIGKKINHIKKRQRCTEDDLHLITKKLKIM